MRVARVLSHNEGHKHNDGSSLDSVWCGRVRAQAERSTPEVSNEPQAGGLMAEWNARPTMCVYRVHM